MVRSVSVNDTRSQGTATPTPNWDDQSARPSSRGSNSRPPAAAAAAARTNGRETTPRRSVRESSDRYTAQSRHARTDSEATGVASTGGYPETAQSGPPRRHDYDVQAMETTITSPHTNSRNPIPAPTVTVRSEFPTVNRSRQQQTLTCLVTVEVPDNKWRPDPEDLQAAPPSQSRPDDGFSPPAPPSPSKTVPRFYPYESPEVLAETTELLRNRVDNWHGLDFSRYARFLILFLTMASVLSTHIFVCACFCSLCL